MKESFPLFTLDSYVDGVEFVTITVPGIGNCEVCFRSRTAGLRAMFVHPLQRRQGIGARMFSEAIAESRKRGMVAIAWTVRKDSKGAVDFYRALGARIFHDGPEDWWMGINLEPGCEDQEQLPVDEVPLVSLEQDGSDLRYAAIENHRLPMEARLLEFLRLDGYWFLKASEGVQEAVERAWRDAIVCPNGDDPAVTPASEVEPSRQG